MSLGRAWVHDMAEKLNQASCYGFEGIEIFYEDLEYLARTYPGGSSRHTRIIAAQSLHDMCKERGLVIICLQPFMHYEGLRDRSKHAERIEELKHWFELAKELGTDLIQIPATFLSTQEATGDINVIVEDLREVADLGASQNPPFRFAHEALAWSTYTDTWEKCYEIVTKVDRPNFGICLDTFNMAGRVYADPASLTGKTPNAEADIEASIARLIKTIDVKKVFFIQIVDAEKLDEPLVEGHPFYEASQPARMSWSRNCRLFYGESDRGAYLPVKEITRAILHGLGFQGWVSAELFNRSMANPSPSTPEEHARRGMASWHKMVKDFGLERPRTQTQTHAELPQRIVEKPQLEASEPRMISVL